MRRLIARAPAGLTHGNVIRHALGLGKIAVGGKRKGAGRPRKDA